MRDGLTEHILSSVKPKKICNIISMKFIRRFLKLTEKMNFLLKYIK